MPLLYHVFLSYKREDALMMHRIRGDLLREGVIVWTDEGIEAGTDSWKIAIEQAIESSHCLLVILTPRVKTSKWVREEISYAEKHGKQVYAVLAEGDEKTSIPFGMTDLQFTDIRTRYENFPNLLIPVLCRYVGVVRLSEQREALEEWERLLNQKEQDLIQKERQLDQLQIEFEQFLVEREHFQHLKRQFEAEKHDFEQAQNDYQQRYDTMSILLQQQQAEIKSLKSNIQELENVNNQQQQIIAQQESTLNQQQAEIEKLRIERQNWQQTQKQSKIVEITGNQDNTDFPQIIFPQPNISVQSKIKPLRPINPFDWAKLLWWIFLDPEKWVAYRRDQGKETLPKMRGDNSIDEKVAIPLLNTLVWLPLFWILLGVAMSNLPIVSPDWQITRYAVFIIPFGWFLTTISNSMHEVIKDDASFFEITTIFVVFVIVALTVKTGLIGVLAVSVAIAVTSGFTMFMNFSSGIGCIAIFGTLFLGLLFADSITGILMSCVVTVLMLFMMGFIDSAIETAVERRKATWATILIFITLIASHAFLIWYSLLGGYQVLN